MGGLEGEAGVVMAMQRSFPSRSVSFGRPTDGLSPHKLRFVKLRTKKQARQHVTCCQHKKFLMAEQVVNMSISEKEGPPGVALAFELIVHGGYLHWYDCIRMASVNKACRDTWVVQRRSFRLEPNVCSAGSTCNERMSYLRKETQPDLTAGLVDGSDGKALVPAKIAAINDKLQDQCHPVVAICRFCFRQTFEHRYS